MCRLFCGISQTCTVHASVLVYTLAFSRQMNKTNNCIYIQLYLSSCTDRNKWIEKQKKQQTTQIEYKTLSHIRYLINRMLAYLWVRIRGNSVKPFIGDIVKINSKFTSPRIYSVYSVTVCQSMSQLTKWRCHHILIQSSTKPSAVRFQYAHMHMS